MSSESKVGGLVELLPCPFCGGTDIGDEHVVTYSVDSSYDTFGCRTCGARFENGNASKWNTRALSAHGQPVVDKAMVKKAVDATVPPDRTCLDHEEYAEAILAAALKGADHE